MVQKRPRSSPVKHTTHKLPGSDSGGARTRLDGINGVLELAVILQYPPTSPPPRSSCLKASRDREQVSPSPSALCILALTIPPQGTLFMPGERREGSHSRPVTTQDSASRRRYHERKRVTNVHRLPLPIQAAASLCIHSFRRRSQHPTTLLTAPLRQATGRSEHTTSGT